MKPPPIQESTPAAGASVSALNSMLPAGLREDLCQASLKAVRRADLASLNALRIIGIDLRLALEYSARCGRHEITRGLRHMNVEVSVASVWDALSHSAESYWALCAPDGKPAHPDEALVGALHHARWELAAALLGRYAVRATACATEALRDGPGSTRRAAPPRELMRALFNAAEDDALTPEALEVAAQHLELSDFEGVCRRAAQVDLRALLVPAFLADRTEIFHALLDWGAPFEPVLIPLFAKTARHLADGSRHLAMCVGWLEQMAARLPARLSVREFTPALERFIVDAVEVLGAGCDAELKKRLIERAARAIFQALRAEDASAAIEELGDATRRLGLIERRASREEICLEVMRSLTDACEEQLAGLRASRVTERAP